MRGKIKKILRIIGGFAVLSCGVFGSDNPLYNFAGTIGNIVSDGMVGGAVGIPFGPAGAAKSAMGGILGVAVGRATGAVQNSPLFDSFAAHSDRMHSQAMEQERWAREFSRMGNFSAAYEMGMGGVASREASACNIQ